MDLIEIIIALLVKAFSGSKTTPTPRSANPDEVVRQIQARIEAARLQQPRADSSQQPLRYLPPSRPQNPAARQKAPSNPPRNLSQRNLPQTARQNASRFKQQSKPTRKRPPALPATPAAPFTVKDAAPATMARQAQQQPPPAKKPLYVDAQVISRWAKPQTLRSQFILTEIFQPPLALRDSHLF